MFTNALKNFEDSFIDEWYRGDYDHAYRNESARQDLAHEDKEAFWNLYSHIATLTEDHLYKAVNSKFAQLLNVIICIENYMADTYKLSDEAFREAIEMAARVYGPDVIKETYHDFLIRCNLSKLTVKESIKQVLDVFFRDPVSCNEPVTSLLSDERLDELTRNLIDFTRYNYNYYGFKNHFVALEKCDEKDAAVVLAFITKDFNLENIVNNYYSNEYIEYETTAYDAIEHVANTGEFLSSEYDIKPCILTLFRQFMMDKIKVEEPVNTFNKTVVSESGRQWAMEVRAMRTSCNAVKALTMIKNGKTACEVAVELGYKSSASIDQLLKKRGDLDAEIDYLRKFVENHPASWKYINEANRAIKFAVTGGRL